VRLLLLEKEREGAPIASARSPTHSKGPDFVRAFFMPRGEGSERGEGMGG